MKIFFISVKLKSIIILISFIYAILLFQFYYYSYLTYINTLEFLSDLNSYYYMMKDITVLLNNFPLTNCNYSILNPDIINNIYKINGFNNYSDFIYPINKDVEVLHQILISEPEVGSRYSSMIIQDIIYNYNHVVSEISEEFISNMVKALIPLAGSLGGRGRGVPTIKT
jgi:hypothetical protein